jgi:hypothetical protein
MPIYEENTAAIKLTVFKINDTIAIIVVCEWEKERTRDEEQVLYVSSWLGGGC